MRDCVWGMKLTPRVRSCRQCVVCCGFSDVCCFDLCVCVCVCDSHLCFVICMLFRVPFKIICGVSHFVHSNSLPANRRAINAAAMQIGSSHGGFIDRSEIGICIKSDSCVCWLEFKLVSAIFCVALSQVLGKWQHSDGGNKWRPSRRRTQISRL